MQRVQTDNGKEFDRFLKKNGIIHFYNYPKSPRCNAYVERLNRTFTMHMSLIELCEHKLSEIAFQVLKENVISSLLKELHGEWYPFFKEEFLKKLKDKGIIKE